LNLRVAIDEHIEVVTPLHDWYRERMYEYHCAKFADFEAHHEDQRAIEARLHAPRARARALPDPW
jgi:hypothetical protein